MIALVQSTLALTAIEKTAVASVIVSVFLGFVALVQLVAFVRRERRRTQPVAIAHESRSRDMNGLFGVFLTNEGSGTAYNVRFGVLLDGVEYPSGGGRGNRHVVGPGARVPEQGDT